MLCTGLAEFRQTATSPPFRLGGLDEAALHLLLAELGGARPAVMFAQWVMEVTAGRPAQVVDLMAQLSNRRLLEVRNGRMMTTVPLERVAVESSPDEIWRTRTGSMSDVSRDRLTWLALLGGGAPFEEMQAVLDMDEESCEDFLAEANRAGVLSEDDGRIYFADDRLRRDGVASLPARVAARREGEIARRLLEHYGEDAEAAALKIVQHLRRCPARQPYIGWLSRLAGAASRSRGGLGHGWTLLRGCAQHVGCGHGTGPPDLASSARGGSIRQEPRFRSRTTPSARSDRTGARPRRPPLLG